MVFRIYPSKSATIASGVYEQYNSGQNAITELWYGGGASSELYRRNSISRFLVYFDLTELSSKLVNYEINENLVTKYTLNLKNAVPRDAVLDPENDFEILNKYIASSYDLVSFPVDKYWDEGRGYDLFKEFYTVKQTGNPHITGYTNWLSATSISSWNQPGVYTNPTASTVYYATQHFDLGDEDIRMDVTDIVKNWISGGSQNYGFGIAFTRDYELISGDSRYVASFYTEKTNSAFKPYIEVEYNQAILDDRKNISNNKVSRLFLYTFSGNNAANYYSASTVTIKNSANQDYITGLTPQHLSKGVYYVDVWMSAATPGQKYFDVWNGVTFAPGYDKQDFRQYFVIGQNPYTTVYPALNSYSLNTYGLDDGSIITYDQVLKVFCFLKVNYTNHEPSTPYILKYRMIMNNQLETIPWTIVNRTVRNNCFENWFELDTSWLLHNQSYKIEFMVEELGTKRIMPETIKFRVIKPF